MVVLHVSFFTLFILIKPSLGHDSRSAVSQSITFYAPFHAIGIQGNITFTQDSPESPVKISVHLISNSQEAQNYSWAIHANPVFYGTKGSCNKVELGKIERKLSDKHGPIIMKPSSSSSSLQGSLDDSVNHQVFYDPDLKLRGPESIWSRSILLSNTNMKIEEAACSNLYHGGQVKTAEAVFTSGFAGKVIFRENEIGETIMYSNLFHTTSDYRQASKHDWKILVTDVFDTKRHDKCNYLSQLFDPDNNDDRNCNPRNHSSCKIGDLTKKHGQITIGSANNRYSKYFFVDTNLPLSSYVTSSSRQLYLVIYDKSERDVLSCAQLTSVTERQVKAEISMNGVKGFFRFSQRYILDPTVVTISLNNLMGRGKWYHIHEFPVLPKLSENDDQCSDFNIGHRFDPLGITSSPVPGKGTNDQYEIGDLSGKYGPLPDSVSEHYLAVFVDMNLPLFGSNSIIGRSVVIDTQEGKHWICASIGYPDDVITSEAKFFYPVYGKIIFRQLADSPLSETTVFADLAYSDSSINSSNHHAWNIHVNPTGRDFYNWSRRCNSVGEEYNPFEVGHDVAKNSKCSLENPLRCSVGDLTSKSRRISISAFKGATQAKLFFTDLLLPLSGPASIIGRSLVIHDDHGPSVRGDRLACTTISRLHPLSASVRRWRVASQGIDSNITGVISFYQESRLDKTTGKVLLHGLNGYAGGYHVHEVSVPIDKEFPCSNDVVYGHFNPLNMDVSVGPLPGASTTDQYEVGDLSGKFGLLDHKAIHKTDLSDSNLPLHGVNSIIGRSIVIHKSEGGSRWVCGSIQADVPRDQGKEIVALASFHEERHLISGYIRLRQIEYKDGSLSNTWIEIDLRYPGSHNRNVTDGHDWAIFVNQVGEDAFNSAPTVKCLAAGFLWNPFLSASDNRHYKTDCNPKNVLRCEMGDMKGKHGPLSIGRKRVVFEDDNLPLSGNFSVMHRSIVIFDKNNNKLKMACANIKPDTHLVSTIAVRRHPTFTVGKFMDHMRDNLKTSPWLISADLESVKSIVDGECLQLSVHFYGEIFDAFSHE
jgi:Cu/Zn superoxide dismutase